MKEAPECMNDDVKNVQEESIEVNLGDREGEKMVKISKNLSKKERGKLVVLLKEYRDELSRNARTKPKLGSAQAKGGF